MQKFSPGVFSNDPSRQRHLGHRVRSRYSSAPSTMAAPHTTTVSRTGWNRLPPISPNTQPIPAATTAIPMPMTRRARLLRPLKWSRIVSVARSLCPGVAIGSDVTRLAGWHEVRPVHDHSRVRRPELRSAGPAASPLSISSAPRAASASEDRYRAPRYSMGGASPARGVPPEQARARPLRYGTVLLTTADIALCMPLVAYATPPKYQVPEARLLMV
jgi:hypothetical protein